MLRHLIAPGYAQIDAAFSDERGDVSGGEEDEGKRKVLDECNVEAGVAMELDVGAVEEVKAGLVETALYRSR